MSKELELFSLDGWGGWFKRTKPHPFALQPGQTCLNCETELAGRFCHVCGQDAETHHRSIFHLLAEAFEGLFHLDGRIWQTLPALFFAPGRLGRDMIDGKMARHVPPFRVFLVSLLVFMLVAEHKSDEMTNAPASHQMEDAQHALDTAPASAKPGVKMTTEVSPGVYVTTQRRPDGTVDRDVTRNIQLFTMSASDAKYLADMVKTSDIQPLWLKNDLYKALNNRDAFLHSMFTWGHRLALLGLPIIGLSLGMLYGGKRRKRRFYLYDHLLVSMNILSFVFLSSAIGLLLPDFVMHPWGKSVQILWTLATFFFTLRGTYGSSILGAIVKSLILGVLTSIAFGLLVLAVMFISLTVG